MRESCRPAPSSSQPLLHHSRNPMQFDHTFSCYSPFCLQGTYEGELQTSTKQLPATTAAAVAAAARALSSTAEPWDSVQMELEVTHTVQSKGCTWGHASLLGKCKCKLSDCF
jgi:hypothetical protein